MRIGRSYLIAGGAVLAAAALWTALADTGTPLSVPAPKPARSHAEAVQRFAALRARDGAEINPVCRSILLSHGKRRGRAIVILHGFTNCPRQFERVGKLLFLSGSNVLIPRLPAHGFRNRMTPALADLSDRELVRAGAEALDIAGGLGDTITIVGLSTSAVVAAALAQRRPDVDRAVLIAPALGPRRLPEPLASRVATVMILAPNRFIWWDSKMKERLGGPSQCYPRFATRCLGRVYRLGSQVLREARKASPKARSIAFLTTVGDPAVENRLSALLAVAWRKHGAEVGEYAYPESLAILHDMIDPEQAGARVDLVYPVLISLALGREAPFRREPAHSSRSK